MSSHVRRHLTCKAGEEELARAAGVDLHIVCCPAQIGKYGLFGLFLVALLLNRYDFAIGIHEYGRVVEVFELFKGFAVDE